MKEFDTAQVEQLKTIGDYLGRERQERGVSLDEIAVKTYIPLRLLQALELGHVERLPEPVFVQGFIRRYADAIGLDGMALAKTFSPQPSFVVERAAEHDRPNPQPERISTTMPSTAEPSYPPSVGEQGERQRTGRSLPLALLGTVAVLVVGAGVLSLNRPQASTEPQSSEPQSSMVQPSPSAAASQSTIATNPETSSSTQASPSGSSPAQAEGTSVNEPTAADAPIQVAVNLMDESWFQVVADGNVKFEGILKKGEQKTWTAKKTLVLQAGNAGAVSVSYNQGEAKRMGTPGEVKEMTFAASKAKPGSAN